MSYRGPSTLYLRYINGTSGTQGEVPLPARVGPRAIPKDTIRDGGEALGQETLADISVATYSRGRVGYIVRSWYSGCALLSKSNENCSIRLDRAI